MKNGDGSAAAGTPGNPCPKRFAFLEKTVVDFLEVFEPTTLADYSERIYADPGQFIR